MTIKRGLILLAGASALVLACDDSNTNPMPDDSVIAAPRGGKSGGSQSNRAGKGGESAAGRSAESAGGKGGEGASGKGGQVAENAGTGGRSGAGGAAAGRGGTGQVQNPVMNSSHAECKDKPDCFCGAPKEDTDFLNQCTEAMCMHYDNSKLKWTGEGAPPPID